MLSKSLVCAHHVSVSGNLTLAREEFPGASLEQSPHVLHHGKLFSELCVARVEQGCLYDSALFSLSPRPCIFPMVIHMWHSFVQVY